MPEMMINAEIFFLVKMWRYNTIIILTGFRGGTGKYQARGQNSARACEGASLTEGLVFPGYALETG